MTSNVIGFPVRPRSEIRTYSPERNPAIDNSIPTYDPKLCAGCQLTPSDGFCDECERVIGFADDPSDPRPAG